MNPVVKAVGNPWNQQESSTDIYDKTIYIAQEILNKVT